jgi:hypothetical protein
VSGKSLFEEFGELSLDLFERWEEVKQHRAFIDRGGEGEAQIVLYVIARLEASLGMEKFYSF